MLELVMKVMPIMTKSIFIYSTFSIQIRQVHLFFVVMVSRQFHCTKELGAFYMEKQLSNNVFLR